jgi:hypothetical protein
MSIPTQEPVTDLLRPWRNGDEEALDRLTPLIYDSTLSNIGPQSGPILDKVESSPGII